MIKKIKKILSGRKVRIFTLFLLCSGLAWLISNLGETYSGTTTFDFTYTHAPDSLLLVNTSKGTITAKLQASGFQFLGFNFRKQQVPIDLSKVKQKGTVHYITHNDYRLQLEQKLPNAIQLVEILDKDTLFFNFFEVYTKTVKVFPKFRINLAQNHLLDGTLTLVPETIQITGPKNEIDTIINIWTKEQRSEALTSNFSKTLKIDKPVALKNTKFSADEIVVSGSVSRFSERILNVPVVVVNLPEDLEIRTFPTTVPVLCQAKLEELKNLQTTDFVVSVNYEEINTSANVLNVSLQRQPINIHSARLLKTQVEYILKKE